MTRLMKNQKGFTLIELLVAIALTAIISTAAAMAIHQVITIVPRNNDQNTAINQVRNAVHWISRDALMAKPGTIVVNNETAEQIFLVLSWENWDGSENHTATYSLIGPSDGPKELRRYYDGDSTGTLIARYIKPKGLGITDCMWDENDKMLTVSITATVGERTETRTFEVKPRPD